MAKEKAAAKGKSTAITKWDARLAEIAASATKTEASVGSGNFITTKSGVMTYQQAEIPGNSLECVIVDHILENAYYEGEFDPDNPTAPVCFAFGREEEGMKPHPASHDPQHETCEGCPQNEFGTADRGKGKACKNTRRLALIPVSDLENVKGSEVAYTKPPVTSVKGWAGYVRQCESTFKKPPLAFVTEIKLVPDPKNQFKMTFTMKDELEGEVIGELLDKREQVMKEIEFPYSYTPPVEKPVRQARGKVTSAKAAARPAGKAAAAGKSKFSR